MAKEKYSTNYIRIVCDKYITKFTDRPTFYGFRNKREVEQFQQRFKELLHQTIDRFEEGKELDYVEPAIKNIDK